MEKRDSWSASSNSPQQQEDRDLSALAGRWTENLEVVVSVPTTITQGPIVRQQIEAERSQE